MNQYSQNGSIIESSSTVQNFMNRVYGWMSVGLLLTTLVAWYTSQSPAILNFVFSSKLTFWGLVIAQLGLVVVLSSMVNRLSASTATALFMLYSALTGLTFSSIFIVYTSSSIFSTFLITAGMFAALSIYGYSTKRDLTGMGSFLFMGLIGIVIASVVNIFLKSPAVMWAITYIGVFVFAGLTAYDTQKLKNLGGQIEDGNSEMAHKYAILGALTLYLDFINLFIMLLRILGDRR